jgi:hypothetical protein
MSCSFYVNNNPNIPQMEISGTTCSGGSVNYLVNYGQGVCMNDDYPIINLNGLVISGDCLPVTPTPTPTISSYCFTSGLTFYTATYECPNDGNDYIDEYGVIKVNIYQNSIESGDHPDYNFIVTNGSESAILKIERGQTFNEFIFPKINFEYGATACTQSTLSNWYISNTDGLSECIFVTQTPTPTNTNTPTNTKTPSVTPTNTITPTVTQTPTNTITTTNTQTPSVTPTNTITPTNTTTATNTQTPSVTPTLTSTPTNTITPTITSTPTQTSPNYCPEEMYVEDTTGFSQLSGATGTYTRTYTYSGGSFNYGYVDYPDFVVGADLSGKTAAVYHRYNATENTYWQSIAVVVSTIPYPVITRWSVFRTTGNYWINGGTLNPIDAVVWTENLTTYNGITYPTKGYGSTRGYFSYPSSCPTATPTATLTQTTTPTNTQTPTNTTTLTQTITNTPSPTETPFNYSFQAYSGTSACLACCSASTLITLYGEFSASTSGPNINEFIYTNPSLNQPVPDGTYIIPLGFPLSPNKWSFVNGGTIGEPGLITSTDPNGCLDCCGCILCTPTPTCTPTNTPTPSPS